MAERTPADLNLQQLRVFLVLGQELHFGRAADRLLLTQPYVSRTLSALERRIGGRLLDRTSRRVTLTPLGKSFHAELTRTYDELARAVDRARDFAAGLRETLVVGCTTTSAGPALTSLINDFETCRPQYRVRVHEVPLNRPYQTLQSGTVDVLVSWLPEETAEFACGPVIEEQPMVLAMRNGHPLGRRKTVSLEELATYGIPDMADVSGPSSIEHILWPSKTPGGRPIPRVGPPCRSMSEIVDSLARSDAVKPTALSVARAYDHRGDLVFVRLDEEPMLRLGPVWSAGHVNDAITALIEVAARIAEQRKGPSPGSSAEPVRQNGEGAVLFYLFGRP
ncbi:LysR family transcriptional regulator [Spirillospora sp. NPDC048819]|uniref:LysR family transcriptional regulator n=1 Tax=Spirillospora sp. NPDC048819 TaxID=3155268 RepID=UPI0033F6BFCD